MDENDRRSAISNQLENVLLRLDRIRRVILSQSADNATNIVNGEANSITRIPSTFSARLCYLITFNNERCTIHGVNAERFVSLCREERVPLEILAGRDFVAFGV